MEEPRDRVALFGGTFDPFHNGHLRLAVEVKEMLGLPEIILLPAHRPPHKPDRPVSAAQDRLAMTRLGVEGLPGFSVSDAELRREGPSYTLTTVRMFRDAHPGADILFVMGADSFADITTWYRHEELLASCDFVVLPRPGTPVATVSLPGLRVEKTQPDCYSWKGETFLLPGGRMVYCPAVPALDISSRSIREKVRTGRCIRGLVPSAVEEYVIRRRLYLT